MNCLNQAIAEERIHQVRLLLSLNVDSETRDKKDKNRTPLLKASRLQCEDSSQKIMKILIRFGVSINAVDDFKRTSLHYACNDGKCKVIDRLLKEHSIKLNEPDENGQTPLMLAAINGHLRASRIIASRLVKFDLNVDVRDDKGYTALLHAVKNQNYAIAYDLIKYANACSTIRDNENFKNATEWLEKTMQDQKKLTAGKAAKFSTQKPVTKDEIKEQANEDKEIEKHKSSRPNSSSVPQATVSSPPLPSDSEVPMNEYSLARMVAESHPKQNPLFENVLNQHHSRPTSSVLSKSSLYSGKNPTNLLTMVSKLEPGFVEQKTRPSTAADDGSFYSCNISQGSKLADDLFSTAGRSLATENKTPKNRSKSNKNMKEKLSTSRKPASNKVDLGPINVPPSEHPLAPTYSENLFVSEDIEDVPEKDLTKQNTLAIEVLKRVLKNQKKSKSFRSSTLRESSAVDGDRRLVSSSLSMRLIDTERNSANTRKKKTPSASSKNLPLSSQKLSMKRFLSHSTILSDDFYSNNYRDPSAIEKAKKDYQTLFSLYTDSLLWAPPPKQPESLIVQTVGNENDKITLTSELATSVNDLASIVEQTSVGQSEDGNSKHEGRAQSTKSRLVSATSKVSRRSARVSSSRTSSAKFR